MSNPWDIPPHPSNGDFDESALFASIGRALTEWEQVEAACAELFAVLVSVSQRSAQHAPAIRAYGTVISFKARCEMLKAAATAYFHHRRKKKVRFEKQLKTLIDECLSFSARRNEIAHGQVSMLYYIRRGKSKSATISCPRFTTQRNTKLNVRLHTNTHQKRSSTFCKSLRNFI